MYRRPSGIPGYREEMVVLPPTITRPRPTATIDSDVRSELDLPPAPPMYYEVVRAIRRDARAKGVQCSKNDAREVMQIIGEALDYVRKHDYQTYLFEIASLEAFARVHGILDAVMPDDLVAEPDSAHEAIQRYYLRGHETAITHTKDHADNCALEFNLATAA
jgi:hypothetical protein